MRLVLPLLFLPALAVFLALALLHAPAAHALTAAGVALATSALAVALVREALRQQLLELTRRTRVRADALAPGEDAGVEGTGDGDGDHLDEVRTLEGSIASLHARLVAQQQALSREGLALTAVLDGMAEGIWVTDARGLVVRHNDALRRMLQPPGEVVGRKPLELVRHEGLHAAVERACRASETSELELTVEGLFPRTLLVRVAPLGRDLPGSCAVFHDVTELRHLEKVRTDFVANVSHELRTPITAIRGYAETLQAGALGEPEVAARMVEIIHRQSERLSELVEDLLELSRIESREVQLEREPVALATAARRALDTVRPKAEGKRQQLWLDVPPGLTARGDARAVEQVLLNLLDNAVKYTPAGGRVELLARAEGPAGACVVRVRDTGVGLEAKHLARIFERFYRVDKGRSRDMGGTGLGLSIVKHLVGAMGGEVRVESAPGAGSTFTVVLPAAPPAAEGARKTPAAARG